MSEVTIEHLNSVILKIDDALKYHHANFTSLADMTADLATQVRQGFERDRKLEKILEVLFSDYLTRISELSNRPRSEVLAELKSQIDQSVPESHLRIV